MTALDRRIFGIETEFAVTCTHQGKRVLSPDEVSRYMFRTVVAWGRSSNAFLGNGSRLYLDVGSHPEYATAECDSLIDLIAQDKAGERIVGDLVSDATQRLAEDDITGEIYCFKNNTDSSGASYGCHENLLLRRSADLSVVTAALIPFLISRQLTCGAGKLVVDSRGEASFAVSQRAEHMWDGMSSATTRSRPIINSRDEPHADAERFRRLHVIVGDSNMSETTALLKVGSADLVLRMVEAGVELPDFTLEAPPTAIRSMSRDVTGRETVRLASGQRISALDVQRTYADAARAFVDGGGSGDPIHTQVLALWEQTLAAIEADRLDDLATTIDWVMKRRLIEAYSARHGLPLNDPRVLQLDLAYHDIDRSRGLYYLLERRGLAQQVVTDEQVEEAKSVPPQTTRAKLRGDFVTAATAHRRDFSVDWVHLKLNDGGGRTLMCKDPFQSQDARVERLIASISGGPDGSATPRPAPSIPDSYVQRGTVS